MKRIQSTSIVLFWSLIGLLALVLSGCASTPSATDDAPPITTDELLATATPTATPTPEPLPLELTSSAFEANQPIPVQYACHGENLSPPLTWSDPPSGTQSLVLILDDPDAVDVVGYVYDHWLVFNLPPETFSLPEGIGRGVELPEGSSHGMNSSFNRRYDGPCPPDGQTHNYVFTLYALDVVLELEPSAKKDELLEVMEGHILDTAQLVGSYTAP